MEPTVTLTKVPGGARPWTSILPEPFCNNPRVIVYMLPNEARFQKMECQEGPYKGYEMTVALVKRNEEEIKIPLQFTGRDIGNFIQQRKVVTDMQGKFYQVAYDGMLADMPDKLNMSADFHPVVGLFSKFHEELFPLKDFFAKFTKEAKING